ncbi:hypothetical protein RND81_06G196000 [Saponaria officinalis]|uniref:Uncharacterized protein n=1 Tax=Saponaria officinalis TaxID=3572 RepID=A0AAW1KDF6_SAPOF
MANKALLFVLLLLLAFVLCKSHQLPSSSGNEYPMDEDSSFQELYTEEELMELIEAEDSKMEDEGKWTIPRRMMTASLNDYPGAGANGRHTP